MQHHSLSLSADNTFSLLCGQKQLQPGCRKWSYLQLPVYGGGVPSRFHDVGVESIGASEMRSCLQEEMGSYELNCPRFKHTERRELLTDVLLVGNPAGLLLPVLNAKSASSASSSSASGTKSSSSPELLLSPPCFFF